MHILTNNTKDKDLPERITRLQKLIAKTKRTAIKLTISSLTTTRNDGVSNYKSACQRNIETTASTGVGWKHIHY